MRRVHFKKKKLQRAFFEVCKKNLNCPSFNSLLQFGINCTSSSLKNYYTGRRLMGEELFLNLCHLAKINPLSLDVEYKSENWGRIKGGKKKLF